MYVCRDTSGKGTVWTIQAPSATTGTKQTTAEPGKPGTKARFKTRGSTEENKVTR